MADGLLARGSEDWCSRKKSRLNTAKRQKGALRSGEIVVRESWIRGVQRAAKEKLSRERQAVAQGVQGEVLPGWGLGGCNFDLAASQ